jgi:hypothetical protein
MRASRLAAIGVVWALLGCAGAASTQGGARPDRARRLTLTREQLAATNSENLYDAIQKLRPDWLTSRGPTSVTNPAPSVVSVYMNGTMLGKADYLKEMQVLDVSEVRYWDAGQASARFGMGHPRGVIEVTRK